MTPPAPVLCRACSGPRRRDDTLLPTRVYTRRYRQREYSVQYCRHINNLPISQCPKVTDWARVLPRQRHHACCHLTRCTVKCGGPQCQRCTDERHDDTCRAHFLARMRRVCSARRHAPRVAMASAGPGRTRVSSTCMPYGCVEPVVHVAALSLPTSSSSPSWRPTRSSFWPPVARCGWRRAVRPSIRSRRRGPRPRRCAASTRASPRTA